jgi:hypothetical protein
MTKISTKYDTLAPLAVALGDAVGDELAIDNNIGMVQFYSNGAVFSSPAGVCCVGCEILTIWLPSAGAADAPFATLRTLGGRAAEGAGSPRGAGDGFSLPPSQAQQRLVTCAARRRWAGCACPWRPPARQGSRWSTCVEPGGCLTFRFGALALD